MGNNVESLTVKIPVLLPNAAGWFTFILKKTYVLIPVLSAVHRIGMIPKKNAGQTLSGSFYNQRCKPLILTFVAQNPFS